MGFTQGVEGLGVSGHWAHVRLVALTCCMVGADDVSQTVIVLQVCVCREAKLEGIGDIFVQRLFPVHALYKGTKLGSALGSRCTCRVQVKTAICGTALSKPERNPLACLVQHLVGILIRYEYGRQMR